MLFSLVTVLGSWCFADRRDSDIPTVKAFKKSHTFMYVHVRLYSHMVLAHAVIAFKETRPLKLFIMTRFLPAVIEC